MAIPLNYNLVTKMGVVIRSDYFNVQSIDYFKTFVLFVVVSSLEILTTLSIKGWRYVSACDIKFAFKCIF